MAASHAMIVLEMADHGSMAHHLAADGLGDAPDLAGLTEVGIESLQPNSYLERALPSYGRKLVTA
jgi:hypothetical protein